MLIIKTSSILNAKKKKNFSRFESDNFIAKHFRHNLCLRRLLDRSLRFHRKKIAIYSRHNLRPRANIAFHSSNMYCNTFYSSKLCSNTKPRQLAHTSKITTLCVIINFFTVIIMLHYYKLVYLSLTVFSTLVWCLNIRVEHYIRLGWKWLAVISALA